MSPLTSPKVISRSVVMLAGQSWLRWTGPGASDQSPEPLVWTVDGDSDRAVNRIELNRIDSFVALTRIESNRSFLPNRPSLITTHVFTLFSSKYIRHWSGYGLFSHIRAITLSLWHQEPDGKNVTIAVRYPISRQFHSSKRKLSYCGWISHIYHRTYKKKV